MRRNHIYLLMLEIWEFRGASRHFPLVDNKQLLDEVEHDIVSYQNRGLCYEITQTRGFDNS